MINFDSLAIGGCFDIGGEIYKKVSPLISQSLKTGQLIYDARLYKEWENVQAPMVKYVPKSL